MRSKEYKYKIGDIVEEIKSGKLKILDQVRIKCKFKYSEKGYKYECLNCGNEDEIKESSLNEGCGCNVCCKPSNKVLKGYNDMYTTNPKLFSILKNPNDGYIYTENSHKRVDFICPNCKTIIKNKDIHMIKQRKLSCPKCSDGISYPNKIMFNILEQLIHNDFKTEIKFEWSNNKRYDFYIEKINCIIEVQGMQHFKDTGFESLGGKTTNEIIINDKLKKFLAINNGIKNYIQIDAFNANIEYIKNNVLNSKLNNLFDLSKLDWLKCDHEAQNSLIIKACNLWNSGIHSSVQIAIILRMAQCTINRYLKKGTKSGFCDYDPIEVNRQNGMINGKIKPISICKKVICLNTKEIFNSIAEANKNFNITSIGICCKGRSKYAGKHPSTGEKLKWMYYKDYIK